MTKTYTVKEAAALLPNVKGEIGISSASAYALVNSGKLAATKEDGRLVIAKVEIDRYIGDENKDGRKGNRPLTPEDAVNRVAAVIDGRATATQVSLAEPPVSLSYISRLVSGERWPVIRAAALEFNAKRKEHLGGQNDNYDGGSR